MNKDQRDKDYMYGKVAGFFTSGGGDALYATAPGLSTAATNLATKRAQILAADSAATQNNQGITTVAHQLRDELVTKVRKVATAAAAYFHSVNNAKGQERVTQVPSFYTEPSYRDILNFSQVVYDNVSPVKTLLTPFNGVTAGNVDAIPAAISALNLAYPLVGEARGDSVGQGKLVDSLFVLADEILDEMDILMEMFYEQVELYNEYKACRRIDDSATNPDPVTYNGTLPAATDFMIIDNITDSETTPLWLKALTDTTLDFSIKQNGIIIGNTYSVAGLTTEHITYATFIPIFPTGGPNLELWVHNSGTVEGSFEVVVG